MAFNNGEIKLNGKKKKPVVNCMQGNSSIGNRELVYELLVQFVLYLHENRKTTCHKVVRYQILLANLQ